MAVGKAAAGRYPQSVQLDIKLLRIFVAIAEENSITTASIRLNVAQPWISKQLKELEDELGVELFGNRMRGKLGSLTVAGQELLPIARRLVASYEDAVRDARAVLDRSKRRLILGIEPISLFIPRRDLLVNQLLSQSNLGLSIVTRTPGELIDGLADGSLDMILTCLPVGELEVDEIPIHAAPMKLAIPKGAVKAYADGLHGKRLLTMPESFHPANHHMVNDALAAYGIEWVICPEASYEALVRFAEMMQLATISPDFSASITELGTQFVMRDLPEPKLFARWSLMQRRGERRPLVKRTWELATELLAER